MRADRFHASRPQSRYRDANIIPRPYRAVRATKKTARSMSGSATWKTTPKTTIPATKAETARQEAFEEDPRGLAVRSDDARIGAADDGPQVEGDAIAQVRAAHRPSTHSNPLPTMLMNTSSRVGSDFWREWTFFPCEVIVLKISATGPSSSRLNLRKDRFFEMSSLCEKFFTPAIAVKEVVSRIASTSSRKVVSVRIIRFRFSGVSHARIFPLSMIAIRSHIWSASAM